MGEEFIEDIDLGTDIASDMGDFELPDFEESVDIPENIVEDSGEDFFSSDVVDVDDSMLGDFSEIQEDVWNEGDQDYDSFNENLIDEIPEDAFENSDMSLSDTYDFDGGETFDDNPNEIQEDTIENTELPYGYEFSGYETHEFPEIENPKVLKRENNYQADVIDEIPEDIDAGFSEHFSEDEILNEIQEDIYSGEEASCEDDRVDSYEDASGKPEFVDNCENNTVVQEQTEAEELIEENSLEDFEEKTNFDNLCVDEVQRGTETDLSLSEVSADIDNDQEFLDKEEIILTDNSDCEQVNETEETKVPMESDGIDLNDKEGKNEFSEEELQENLNRTPINNGEWVGERGESTWIPEDDAVRETVERYGVEGIEYRNGIPDFDKFSAFDIELNENEFTEKNVHQFMTCNEGLADYFSDLSDQLAGKDCEDPLENADYRNAMMNVFKCDEAELEDIQSHLYENETPYGFTWHHSPIPGKMQLIPTDIHVSARHRGGQSIWGGGASNR